MSLGIISPDSTRLPKETSIPNYNNPDNWVHITKDSWPDSTLPGHQGKKLPYRITEPGVYVFDEDITIGDVTHGDNQDLY